ncbi:MAG: CRISPR-associated protein Cas5 [Armatimonadota bacterium]
MNRALAVQVAAPVASFRRPLDHTYQRTLLLPPPTTLLGLVGAALGLDAAQLWSDASPLRRLQVQVLAHNTPARATDMWTLLKIKAGKMERSPYLRELLFHAQFTLLYGGAEELLSQLSDAFQQPAYPLSLGREDELLCVVACEQVECAPASPPYLFYGTILPGDLRMLNAQPVLREGMVLEPAVVERLPTRFQIEPNGVRQPLDVQPFTFLPYSVQVQLNAWNRPVFQYGERQFVWLP